MDKYVFNWNAVLAHCPEYKKYLVDISLGVFIKSLGNVRNDITVRSLIDGRTEEELEVIKQMSGSKQPADQEAFEESREPEQNIGPVYTLDPVYQYQPLPVKMNPLQLAPPKCVLDVGSEMFFAGKTGWHMNYQIVANEHHDGSVDLIKTKVNETEDKIQSVRATYWFNQAKNVISDCSGEFKCLTYNKKTRNLYYVYRTPKKLGSNKKSRRYKSNVRGILLSKMSILTAVSGVNQIMLKSFVDIVEKAVLKDVPDAYIPAPDEYRAPQTVEDLETVEYLCTKLLVLLLQHKANARLDWLNYNVLSNSNGLLNIQTFEDQITGNNTVATMEHISYIKYCNNDHTKRVRKIVPALRSKRSLKALTKAICGKFYSQILIKLMSAVYISPQSWINLLQALHNERMPKFLYHWLSNVLSNGVEGEESLERVVWQILLTMDDLNSPREPTHIRNITIIDLWVKTCKRFLSNGDSIVPWFTWRDMYNMADRLNLRLRPNKLRYLEDVRCQHDLLSELTNRNRSMLQDYADVIFREFAIPENEYAGFTFVQLRNVEELVHEGQTMHHCVGGYSHRCVSGNSIIFSMRKGDRSYVTIELNGTTFPCSIRQQYTIDDVRVTSEFALELINKWLEDVRKLHSKDKLTYAQECKNMVDKINAENRLRKLTKLKAEAADETLAHINNECAELERQLATWAMGTTQVPPPNDTLDELPQILEVLCG